MKIIIAPDSFKGSLTSTEISKIIETGLRNCLADKAVEFFSLPIADGGEGTLDAFMAALPDAQLIKAKSTGPFFNEITAPYLMQGTTAVIESAKVCGYISPCLGKPGKTDILVSCDSVPAPSPMNTTTFGLGLLIRDALLHGAKKIIVGLGGSCTNDGGCGMAAALGAKFYGFCDNGTFGSTTDDSFIPANGTFTQADGTFIPTGGTLSAIAHIDASTSNRLLGSGRGSYLGKAVDIVGMCDVTNPLTGNNGASHIFGPQKGASPDEVLLMDAGLSHLVSLIDDVMSLTAASAIPPSAGSSTSISGRAAKPLSMPIFPGDMTAAKLSNLPGSGAAGGLGFGIRAFAGGRLERGIDLLLDTADFDDLLWNADYVITGEGRLDSQSLNGKAVSSICSRALAQGARPIIICGTADESAKSAALAKSIPVIETGSIDFARLTETEAHAIAAKNLENVVPLLAKHLLQL